VQNLDQAIEFQQDGSTLTSTDKTVCVFWNPGAQKWSQEECSVSNVAADKTITCACTHLTSFSLGVEKPPTSNNNGKNDAVMTTMAKLWPLF